MGNAKRLAGTMQPSTPAPSSYRPAASPGSVSTGTGLLARDAILAAVGFAAEQFLKSPSWQACVQPVLDRLGLATGVSRVYLFENHTTQDGLLVASQRNEYVAPGIAPQLDNPDLQGIPYEAAGFGRWAALFSQGLPVYGLVHEFPSSEAEMLAAQDIRSLAVVPISVGAEWLGFIGFDDCQRARRWSVSEVDALKVAAGTLGAAMRREQAEAAIRASERRYRTLIREASDAIFIGLPEGCFLEVNAQACALTGYTRAELLQKTPEDLLSAQSIQEQPVFWRTLVPGETLRFEREFLRKDGTMTPVEASLTLVDANLVQAIVRDITARKKYEHQLIAAKERAEEIANFKASLLTNLSHEIRTPLTGILGFTEILFETTTSDNREMIQHIQQSGNRLLATLDAVLNLAEIEGRSFQLAPERHDLVALTRRSLEAFRTEAEAKNLALVFDAPSRLEAFVDQQALARVLVNLLANALKFTRAGRVTVRLAERRPDVLLCVEDTGIGISPAFLPHVFDDFKQESTGFSRCYEGTGLGLALTKRLVDLMGGAITAESEEGAGAAFTVVLPGRPPEEGGTAPSSYPEA